MYLPFSSSQLNNNNLTQSDLGGRVMLSVTVSSGRSTIPSVELDIFIPSNDSASGRFFYIYPGSIDEVGGVLCRRYESCW